MRILLNNTPGTTTGVAGYFNVKDATYAGGAKGDGLTDDTAAIDACIAACVAAGGGRVYFPIGHYIITSQIVIGGDNVKLIGDGAVVTGTSETQFRKFYAAGRTDLLFDGITFDGVYSSMTPGISQGAVELVACTFSKVRDCFFKNNAKNGVYLQGACVHVVIESSKFTNNFCDILADWDSGTTLGAVNLRISDNDFYNGISAAAKASYSGAIKIHTSGNTINTVCRHILTNNHIYKSGEMGIELQGYINDSVISLNNIYGTKFGTSVSTSSRTCHNGNIVKGCTYIGMECSDSEDISFTGNNVDGKDDAGTVVTSYGIILNGTSPKQCSIIGGSVNHCGECITLQSCTDVAVVGVSMTFAGSVCLQIHNSSHIGVSDCVFRALSGANYFIFLDSSDVDVNWVKLNENQFYGNVNYHGIYFYHPAHSITDIEIRHNIVDSSASGGFWGYGSGTHARIWIDSNIGDGTQSGQTNLDIPVYSLAGSTYADYNLNTFIVDASGGAQTITLLSAVGMTGLERTIVKSDSSGNAVGFATTSSQTISGKNAAGSYVSATTYSLLAVQGSRVKVKSDGANWIILESK